MDLTEDAPDAQPVVRQPADPGALLVAQSIAEAIGIADVTPAGTVISIRTFRNQSETGSGELQGLRNRVLALLAIAGDPYGLRFEIEDNADAEFTLGGTVYLVNRDGFDLWEVYFILRPADANWSIWRNDHPVRLLRQVRPEGDQMHVLGIE